MSYKSLMVKKLFNVQKKLMSKNIKSESLEDLLPLLFKECEQEGMMFYFNFIEDACVLNLCDISEKDHELRIRCHYDSSPVDYAALKKTVLLNAFLITEKSETMEVASSVKQVDEKPIISSEEVMPKSIRKAIERIQKKGIEVTPESIRNHLPLSQMSVSNRLECNKYLKMMEGCE